ncbi:MAG: tRNA (adenosine(37)-N6)-threonylcarbamoyltransferase complex transferase subunit TsaD [Acidimicrobiales bacterium]|nr:tRNA (adenosine(37)-N6)-threonylcarbamoyltransferase complex transferase subunit TsaD [Hyphomonadaceae bacterium]RZV41267.1 MAG: tRNA (adenosine(37)-N6)-threonylcarbamoyltransferase complex transferase subunit TsaD [Acidimicrobiales bacterium]
MFVLGVESSCDETAASVVARDTDGTVRVLSSIIASQHKAHAPYGGVVPEIAARAHMQKIEGLIADAMTQAEMDYAGLNAVAATAGPGLIGGVITGLMVAKGLSLSLNVPLIGVNHLEGHALSPRLSEPCDFPYLLLLVSGGHTQLLSVKGLGDYERLGSTVDDAAGEAFDKTAKIMSLGFPGGPALERTAKAGDPNAIKLPRPFVGKPHADFSFAGLKTASRRAFDAFENPSEQNKADLAASFQLAVTDVIIDRTRNAMGQFQSQDEEKRLVVAGGVAANSSIRAGLEALCVDEGFQLFAPPLKYCTDNAAMIALAGAERFAQGQIDQLDVKARPRWPLDDESASVRPASGSGRKGPKS